MSRHVATPLRDGVRFYFVESGVESEMVRMRTEHQVPVPSRSDAIGQHLVARVTHRAGFTSLPPYHPLRRS